MTNNFIADISDFIFVSDEPERADAIFLPGGSNPEQPEYAAELYHKGYAKWLIPSGGISVKSDKWHGARSKADIYNGDYQSDCEFFTDVLIKTVFLQMQSSENTNQDILVIMLSFLEKLLMRKV